jgi:hypothetical protein
MARAGRSLSELVREIEARIESKKDIVAPVSKLRAAVVDKQPKLILANGGDKVYDINQVAHAQVAEYAGIPLPYYKRMQDNDPDLLCTNINRWLEDKANAGEARMLRLLGPTMRAMLSRSFRVTLECEDMLEAALPVIKEVGGTVVSCDVTDTKMYVKVVDHSIQAELPEGVVIGEGHNSIRVMSPALTVGTSEVGHGSAFVRYGVWDGKCTNLMGFEYGFRQVHTGTRHAITDEAYELLSDATKTEMEKATLMQIADFIRGGFDRARFDARMIKMRGAVEDKLPVKDVVEVVTRAARKFNFTKVEQEGVQAELIEGGNFTRFGLQAAVTKFSQSKEVSYDRASELEGIGGDIIELAPSQWRELVAA